jgi:hypothetical protein
LHPVRESNLDREDEGDFWSTGDKDALQEHFAAFERAIAEHLRENPDAEGPVLLSGRWIDVIS